MKKILSIMAVSVVIAVLLLPFILPHAVLADTTIANPLKNVNSIQQLISVVLKFVVNLLAIAGVMWIMWTGMLFVMAQGKPDKLAAAQKSFMNAVIGMAIILGAWAIATVIANTINNVTQNQSATLTVPK